jgi:hypothetical protein
MAIEWVIMLINQRLAGWLMVTQLVEWMAKQLIK